jgi:hypothetical protein
MFQVNPTVRGIQQLRENSVQTNRDKLDVLRHIIKNVSERLVQLIESPAPVTKRFFFLKRQKRVKESFEEWKGVIEPVRTLKTLPRLYKLKS